MIHWQASPSMNMLLLKTRERSDGFASRHASPRSFDRTVSETKKGRPVSLRLVTTALLLALTASAAWAQVDPIEEPRIDQAELRAAKAPVPLNREETVLLDAKNRKLIVNSEVVLREGLLEMLLCKRHSKEHESILAFAGNAYILHAGLVALGIDPGRTVRFTPEYQPPTGPKLELEVVWTDESGREQRADARSWMRYSIHRYFGEPLEELPANLALPEDDDLRYDATNKELSWYGPMTAEQRDKYLALSEDPAWQKAIRSFYDRTRERQMDAEFVFAGSGFDEDHQGRKVYLAESGDVICVANFPSAMIDVAKKSSAEGQENLLFEAWTERIPPLGTKVRLEIRAAARAPQQVGAGQPAASKPSATSEKE
jgi:hypothetical protein